ncbi:MAG: hypothetical protein QG657_4177 [Acidobacteriota bacterium]|nr:hypothetical protein [Acidobacteriota bacterium]
MLYKTNRFADFFQNSRKALVNARDDKNIYSLILEYNMTAERIEEGLTKIDNLVTADRNKTELHGLQLLAREEMKRVFAEANPLYMEHVAFTKLHCREESAELAKLLLNEPRTRVINGWIRQADTFYSNLFHNPGLIERLAVNAVTVEKLQAGHEKVMRVSQARVKYTEAIGMAQVATDQRNRLLAEFKYWMREFIYVCKAALKNQPQLLEVLGIQVLSNGYRRQIPERQ